MQKRRLIPSFFCADFLSTFCCFWHKCVYCKLFFLFGCHAVVANCAFARYCQKFVAFITSARYCVGILRFSQCIFVVLQHNKSDFRYLLVSSTFQRQKIVFVIFFAFEITCVLKNVLRIVWYWAEFVGRQRQLLQCVAPFEYNVQGKPDFTAIY